MLYVIVAHCIFVVVVVSESSGSVVVAAADISAVVVVELILRTRVVVVDVCSGVFVVVTVVELVKVEPSKLVNNTE